MANEPLTDETMARIDRHMATERRLRHQAEAQRRRSDNTPPEAWQERHSPTEAVEVVIQHKVELGRNDKGRLVSKRVTQTREVCRRRLTDARLWGSLSEEQQQAATLIEAGFQITTRGLGAKIQSFERGDRGVPSGNDRSASVMADYIAWARQAVRDRVDHAAIILVLVEGMSLAAVDSARRRRNGFARGHLVEGLNLYCKQQGWAPQTTS